MGVQCGYVSQLVGEEVQASPDVCFSWMQVRECSLATSVPAGS